MPRARHRYPPPASPEIQTPSDRRRHPVSQVGGRSGMAVDFMGGPVIDPTANVLALVEAANQRQDDLREMNNARIDAELRNQEQMAELRAMQQVALDALEAKRLDAVRSVDQLAAKTEADRSAAAVTALATAASATAETLRSAVNTSATNLATQLDRTVTAITERIAALEKSSYTGQGKQAVVDPQVAELLVEMRAMRTQQSEREGKHAISDPTLVQLMAEVKANTARLTQGQGKAEGMDATWKLLVAGVGMLVALNALGVFNRVAAVPPAPPSVIYVPAPPNTMLPSTPPTAVPR